MKKLVALAVFLSGITLFAGNAHFVGAPKISTSDDVLTVSGKVAGLGNVPQIHVEVTADAACVNRGGNNPNADNKESFGAAGDFPVQNGKALFSLSVLAEFQPDCAPPMMVSWSNVVVVVTAEDGTLITFP